MTLKRSSFTIKSESSDSANQITRCSKRRGLYAFPAGKAAGAIALAIAALAGTFVSGVGLDGALAQPSLPASPASCQPNVTAYAEIYGGQPIVSEGDYYAEPYFCSGATANTTAQRKVCGFFGCNWYIENSTGYQPLTGSGIAYYVSQTCISGLNRYRTEDFIVSGGDHEVFSTEPEFSC